jgi:hypothetical protein
MPTDLMERVLHGGSDAAHALRLLELQVLSRLVQSPQHQSSAAAADPLLDAGGHPWPDSLPTRGAAALHAVHRGLSEAPETVMREFNEAIQRELETNVTGMPWSLRAYVERRMRFAADQETEERMVTILCRLHTLFIGGPENWHRIGATIAQSFKSMEHFVRERDWQSPGCGWTCRTLAQDQACHEAWLALQSTRQQSAF